jgi:hypothetical protein
MHNMLQLLLKAQHAVANMCCVLCCWLAPHMSIICAAARL